MAVAGYNVAFRLENYTIAGRTQDDLTIAAQTRERLTKDDQGSTQVVVYNHDFTFRATALLVVDGEGITREELMAWSLLTDYSEESPELAFTYRAGTGDGYKGYCKIMNYSESSNASDDATVTVDFRVTEWEKINDSPTPNTPTPNTP